MLRAGPLSGAAETEALVREHRGPVSRDREDAGPGEIAVATAADQRPRIARAAGPHAREIRAEALEPARASAGQRDPVGHPLPHVSDHVVDAPRRPAVTLAAGLARPRPQGVAVVGSRKLSR